MSHRVASIQFGLLPSTGPSAGRPSDWTSNWSFNRLSAVRSSPSAAHRGHVRTGVPAGGIGRVGTQCRKKPLANRLFTGMRSMSAGTGASVLVGSRATGRATRNCGQTPPFTKDRTEASTSVLQATPPDSQHTSRVERESLGSAGIPLAYKSVESVPTTETAYTPCGVFLVKISFILIGRFRFPRRNRIHRTISSFFLPRRIPASLIPPCGPYPLRFPGCFRPAPSLLCSAR